MEAATMLVGFIGTRDGLTDKARGMLEEVLRRYYAMAESEQPEFHTLAHLGGCTQGLELARWIGFAPTAHLTEDVRWRNAFVHERGAIRPRLIEPKPVVLATQHIVRTCNAFCAAVPSYIQIISSQTWTAVQYAQLRRLKIALVYPDGKMKVE